MASMSPAEERFKEEQGARFRGGDIGVLGENVQEAFSRYTPLGWFGLVKDPFAESQARASREAAEGQLASAGKHAEFLRGTQADLVRQLMNQDPTQSRGFQQALAQSQGAIGRSLGASGLGDSPFAAALQGQGAGQLAANFEQQRMAQLFQALGLNSGLAASPELSAQLLKMLSEDPNMLAELLKTLGPAALAAL